MTIKDQVINARANGYSYGEITREFGVAKSTARDWVTSSGGYVEDTKTGHYVNENIQRVKPQKFQRTEENVLEFLSNLAPLNFAPVSRSVTSSHSDHVVVLSDMHFPMHCEKTCNIALETIRQLQPKEIILNGDTVDMLSVSRFPKDIRHQYTLLDERNAYQQFLRDLISVSNGASIVETSANHSGNGIEGRWFRYLSERLCELACLPELQEQLSYQNVFLGDFQESVQYVDYVEVCSDLVVLHGDVVRKNGGYSARGMLDKYYQSLIMGHTHRLGMTAQRMPGIGTKPEKQIYAWEMGCMCNLDPVYASAPNWQNGFGIIAVDSDGNFGVEPVMVQNGKATINTIGSTISA